MQFRVSSLHYLVALKRFNPEPTYSSSTHSITITNSVHRKGLGGTGPMPEYATEVHGLSVGQENGIMCDWLKLLTGRLTTIAVDG